MIVLFAILWAQALAGPEPAELLDALEHEMARSVESLSLSGSPSIYHLRHHLVLLEQERATASFGGLLAHERRPHRRLGVEVRVGSPELDNTGFGGWQNGFRATKVPRDLDPDALRIEAWRLTDRAFKEAVEQYSRKQAQYTPPDDHPGDYLLTGAVRHEEGAWEDLPSGEIPDLARRLSSAFSRTPALERGQVAIVQASGAHWVVDSEGSRVLRPIEEVSVRAIGHARAPDGMLLTDQRLWTVRHLDQLPEPDALASEIEAMAEGLVNLTAQPTLGGEYVGPVLFEGPAAAQLFRYLLVPQIEGTPAQVPFDTWFGAVGASRTEARIGRRVLPSGWGVVDDPTRDPGVPAHFLHDYEGTPAGPADLVRDGIVEQVLMSRVPRPDLKQTTGHARGALGRRLSGRTASLQITPDRVARSARLQRRALRAASRYGSDHVLVVRRLQEPRIRARAAGARSRSDDDNGVLPPPVEVIKRYRDGREEVVRGAAFTGVHRFVLRDLRLAGANAPYRYLAHPREGDERTLGPLQGLPTAIDAPSALLVGEMELVPIPPDRRQRPVLSPLEP